MDESFVEVQHQGLPASMLGRLLGYNGVVCGHRLLPEPTGSAELCQLLRGEVQLLLQQHRAGLRCDLLLGDPGLLHLGLLHRDLDIQLVYGALGALAAGLVLLGVMHEDRLALRLLAAVPRLQVV